MSHSMNLHAQLEGTLQGRVCLMGLGNPDYGDDGFGVRLAEELLAAGVLDVVVAGTAPDLYVGVTADQEFDHLVFLDAVEFGSSPGSAVFLDSQEIEARFPQISTHKISLSAWAKFIESNGITKTWLLGVQPKSIRHEPTLSPCVRTTLDVLLELLFRLKTKDVSVC
jgi:hydrogenase maturation protease